MRSLNETRLGRHGHRLAQRVVRRAYRDLQAGTVDFPLAPRDIADSTRLTGATPAPVSSGRPLTIGWLCAPPGAGSGGHTTMFRMVQALEAAGHRCVVLVHFPNGGNIVRRRELVRTDWPWVKAEVVDVDDTSQVPALDACVATGWPSAHLLARRFEGVHRFYFIQDYEPFFYPRGADYELASDTYRFGFHNIALGTMVQRRLKEEVGVVSDVVPFSCDTTVYGPTGDHRRSGVVFYTRPDVARRGYRLGSLALEEFHRRHPEQEIHLYGEPALDIAVPVTRHGRLTPAQLNDLYNRTLGGFAMSFTNISLVAEEMLAAGCVPVVNDSPDARADLPNEVVAWAQATPGALADALCGVVESPRPAEQAARAAASVRRDNWSTAGREVVQIIESVVWAR